MVKTIPFNGAVATILSRPLFRHARKNRRPVAHFDAEISVGDDVYPLRCTIRGGDARQCNRALTPGMEVRLTGVLKLVPVFDVRRVEPIEQRFRATLA